jgi:hypothetical protein
MSMGGHLEATVRLALCLTALCAGAALPAGAEPARPIVAADMVVEDKTGKPVVDLKRGEVAIFQGEERQELTVFRPLETPGQYEVQYVPRSGQPGAMSVGVLRRDTRVRGVTTPALQPLILRPPTALEAQLESLLETAKDSNALSARVGLLSFERDARGQHQTVAVEVEARELHSSVGQHGRLQVFARFRDAQGRVRERLAFDRPVESSATVRLPNARVAPGAAPAFERIVWTGHLHLPTGAYSADVLVLDAASGRSSARRLTLAVAEPVPGPQISSVAVLQPREFLHLAEPVADDPLIVGAEPVMPALSPELPAGGSGQVRFYATLYPDAKSPEPLTLKLELRRGDALVGNVPLQLPPPSEGGETRYVGLLATKTLRPAAYVIRLVVSQGAATSDAETSFTLVPAVPTAE